MVEKIRGKWYATDNLTLKDVQKQLILIFGSIERAAEAAEITSERIYQIFSNGHDLPRDVATIYRYASAWNIDPVVLTILFIRERYSPKSELNTEQPTKETLKEVRKV